MGGLPSWARSLAMIALKASALLRLVRCRMFGQGVARDDAPDAGYHGYQVAISDVAADVWFDRHMARAGIARRGIIVPLPMAHRQQFGTAGKVMPRRTARGAQTLHTAQSAPVCRTVHGRGRWANRGDRAVSWSVESGHHPIDLRSVSPRISAQISWGVEPRGTSSIRRTKKQPPAR